MRFGSTGAEAVDVKDWQKLEDVSRAGPWLYRIAIRQAMLFRRRMGRQRQLMDRYCQEVGEPSSQEPLEWLMGEERGKAIRAAMSELAPRDREILLLKHGEGWSYQKIADHLGVTRHVVEYRLLRARKHMRSTLAAKRLLEVTS